MRPHRLRVTAFGAFGGTVEVCFDDLAKSGLFLLHGETGAGKTTLLDALGFALYGRVPGERGKARRLRSDHAAADVPTEIQLEATLGGRRMRITRRPEQERPKRRGGGTTTEHAKVLLEESDGAAWRAVSTRAGEADDEIKDLVGMSAEQFFQVVLLPQGQFAQFLHADATDRARLLQRLFATDRFSAVEQWLAERRRTTAGHLEQARQGIAELVARIAQVAMAPAAEGSLGPADAGEGSLGPADAGEGSPGPAEAGEGSPGPADASAGPSDGPAGPGDDLPSPAWADGLAAAAAAESAACAGQVRAHRAGLDQAQAALHDQERLAARQQRRAEALRTRDQLAEAAPAVDALRGELDAAVRAAVVVPSLTEAGRAADALADAREAEEQARAAIAEVPGARGVRPDEAAAGLRARAEQQVTALGRLEALRSLAAQAADEDAAADAARAMAGSLADEVTAVEAEAAGHRERRPGMSRERDQARAAGERLPEVQAEADRHRRAADDAAALVRAHADSRRQGEAYVNAKADYLELYEEASRLRRERIDGMRAELAATLLDGTPCPVCGSLDHPELCELRGNRVTREQEEAADAEAARASERAESIAALVGIADSQIADLSGRLEAAGFAVTSDPFTLEAEASRLAAAAGELAAEAARLAELRRTDHQAALDELDQALAEADTRVAELTSQRKAVLGQADGADQRAARHRQDLRAQLDGAPDLDAALAAVRAAADALTAAAEAADAATHAGTAARDAQQRAEQAAAEAGFADLDAVRQARRDSGWRTTADQARRDHEAKTAAVAELLADAELDVALDPPADVACAAATAEAARKVYDEAVTAHAHAQRQAEQLADLAPALRTRLAEFEPLAERAAEARRLADLAAGLGANTLRMTLSSFVLAARLEEVAAAASERLLKMTSGRYSLVHTDARRGGSGKSGLGLLACDTWTGIDRDTSTLSGGETFLASLALALGLADVVTAEAGGTRIEALFVDEGFGSLDEDTLEEVMTVLDGLREGGRMVGIVSHVAELRQRIPAQVRVHKAQGGSHVQVRAPSG